MILTKQTIIRHKDQATERCDICFTTLFNYCFLCTVCSIQICIRCTTYRFLSATQTKAEVEPPDTASYNHNETLIRQLYDTFNWPNCTGEDSAWHKQLDNLSLCCYVKAKNTNKNYFSIVTRKLQQYLAKHPAAHSPYAHAKQFGYLRANVQRPVDLACNTLCNGRTYLFEHTKIKEK